MADLPSGDPLASLTLRQLLVFTVRAHHRSLSELSRLLGVSRMTLHDDLERAMTTLAGSRRPLAATQSHDRGYSCPEHRLTCGKGCRYLREWLRDFDRSYPREGR